MAQKQYLKMADVFIEQLDVREKSPRLLDCCGILAANFLNEDGAKYAAHAINSHDELVAENERLRELVRLARDCQSVQLSHLKSLLSSVSGDCYMGEEWEIEKIKSAIKYTIDHKW